MGIVKRLYIPVPFAHQSKNMNWFYDDRSGSVIAPRWMRSSNCGVNRPTDHTASSKDCGLLIYRFNFVRRLVNGRRELVSRPRPAVQNRMPMAPAVMQTGRNFLFAARFGITTLTMSLARANSNGPPP